MRALVTSSNIVNTSEGNQDKSFSSALLKGRIESPFIALPRLVIIFGKAVHEHLMHIATGPYLAWIKGKPAITELWVVTAHTSRLVTAMKVILSPNRLPTLSPSRSQKHSLMLHTFDALMTCTRRLRRASTRGQRHTSPCLNHRPSCRVLFLIAQRKPHK